MKSKKRTLPFVLLSASLVMIGVAYASVPLYRMFCSATGFGGTTQRVALTGATPASEAARPVSQPEVRDRWVTVTFDGNTDRNLPWDFGPDQRSVKVKLGQVITVTYHAHNRGDKTLVGTATFNVQPDIVGEYFDKIQCFCFTKQVLKPGETATLPVQFFVDPALVDDKEANEVHDITLSYTFFLAKDQSLAAEKNAQQHANASSTTSSTP